MAGEVRAESEQPKDSQSQVNQHKNWLKERLSKTPKPVKVAGSVIGAGLAIFAGLTAADRLDSEGTESPTNQPTAAKTIEPTTDATDVRVIPIKTSPPSTETPSPTATPTASSVSETPIPTPQQTETPQPVENKPSGNWTIAPQSPDSQVTQESWSQAKLTVEQAFEKFPHIGNINVYIVEGIASAARFSQDPEKPTVIFFGEEGNLTNILNELSGYFRINLNNPTLSLNYTPETLAKLEELDPQIIAPYTDYSPQNIFGEKMLYGSAFSKVASVPYTFYVGQSIALPSENGPIKYPLERPLFAQMLDSPLYGQFAQETEGQINNSPNFAQFAQDQHDRLEQLKASSPIHSLAIDWLEQNAALLKYANVLSGPGLQLDDKYLSGYFAEVLPIWENYALTRLFDQKDPGLLAMFEEAQIKTLAANHQKLLDAVENEIFIRALNMQIQGVTNDPAATQYYQLIWQEFR